MQTLPSGTGYIQCIKPHLIKPPLDLLLSIQFTWYYVRLEVKCHHSECIKSVTSSARSVSNLHVPFYESLQHVTQKNTPVLHFQYVLPWNHADAQNGVYIPTSFINSQALLLVVHTEAKVLLLSQN